MADHEDYLPGEQPAPHKASHQDGGADEISVAGLSGETEELAAHKILPSVHHAKYTDAEAQAVADAQIAAHAALPTVHQDAPALIETHRLNASAHHSKYTDAEARAAINNIFGSDGKADADIDLDTHKLINVVDPVANQDGDTKKGRDDAIAAHAALPSIHHARYTDSEAVSALQAANGLFKTDFNATSFLYATLDDTPEPKTPAEVLAILSGKATSPFNLNYQNLTGVREIQLGGWDIIFKADDCGDIVFRNADNSEKGRIWAGVGAGENCIYIRGGTIMGIDISDLGNVNICQHNGSTIGLKLGGNLVTYGANDSGGTGYKSLRVPN